MEPVVASSLLVLLHRIKHEPPRGRGLDFSLFGEQDAELAADLVVLERHGLISTAELRSVLSLGKFRHLTATLTDVGRALSKLHVRSIDSRLV
jgi:hypothetical protein